MGAAEDMASLCLKMFFLVACCPTGAVYMSDLRIIIVISPVDREVGCLIYCSLGLALWTREDKGRMNRYCCEFCLFFLFSL